MRLSRVDPTNIADHPRLTDDDDCYFIFEYTSGRNFAFSATNNRINNLKKKPSTSSEGEKWWKGQAIQQCAADLRQVLSADWLAGATLVPVPCSKTRDHADFDDRMERVARGIGAQADVRSLVIQTASTVASHEAGPGERVTVEQLLDVYAIDEALAAPAPATLGILDDVLTAGTHYRAMQIVLSQRFPGVPIVGIFVARRVFPNPFEAEA